MLARKIPHNLRHDQTSLHRLFNHNPFYVISAALVLFGLHKSFTGSTDPNDGWMMLRIYCGYMAILAVATVVIIKFGRVWEDARMVLLIIVLLFVALSNSFDGVVMKDPWLGTAFLIMGFGFAVFLTEIVLWALGLRLMHFYRTAFYCQVLLMFGFPALLGHLAHSNGPGALINIEAVSCGVLLFPVAVAASIVILLPAAQLLPRQHCAGVAPWRWPIYPWSLFAITIVGLSLRSYSLSLSFETAIGLRSGFQLYFLIPILLAIPFVLLEIAIVNGYEQLRRFALFAPFATLLLGLPGEGTFIQQRFLLILRESVGNPIQMTLYCLIAFYGIASYRRIRFAENGLAGSIFLSLFVNTNTVNLLTISRPASSTLLIIAALLLVIGIIRRASLPVVASFVVVVVVTLLENIPYLLGQEFYVLFVHGLLAMLLGLGLTFDDRPAKLIRHWAAWSLPTVATTTAFVLPLTLTASSAVGHFVLQLNLILFAALYWLRAKRVRELTAATITTGSMGIVATAHILKALQQAELIRGLGYLVWGLAFLAIALLVSLLKGGFLPRIRIALRRLNRRVQQAPQAAETISAS
jgi:hypothetical protein